MNKKIFQYTFIFVIIFLTYQKVIQTIIIGRHCERFPIKKPNLPAINLKWNDLGDYTSKKLGDLTGLGINQCYNGKF
jgi:hypothetical protein